MTRRTPPRRSLPVRRERHGFTLSEALIAVTLFILVVGLAVAMFTGMSRDVLKGEDALTSVQDASLILLHLRRDLRRLVFPGEDTPRDLRHIHIRGTDFVQDDLHFDPSTRRFQRRQQLSDNVNAHYKEDKTELEFHIFDTEQSGYETVTFSYLPESSTIVRKVGGQPPRSFAVPRLKDFRLHLEVQEEGASAARKVFGGTDEWIGPVVQLWFHVEFLVKGERGASGPETTRVQIETMIFPRNLNRRLHACWQGGGDA